MAVAEEFKRDRGEPFRFVDDEHSHQMRDHALAFLRFGVERAQVLIRGLGIDEVLVEGFGHHSDSIGDIGQLELREELGAFASTGNVF